MKSLQRTIRKYLQERGWDKLRPSDLAKSISIEAGELLELFQWSNPSLGETNKDALKKDQIKKELADVFIYCLDMATLLDMDAEQVIRQKLAVIAKKYPPGIMKNTQGKEPGTDDSYLTIKRRYRRKGLP